MTIERPNRLPPLEIIGWIGVVALFVVAAAFGVLEVHSSNDTWIGLAAGRQILESAEFPKKDTFSFTSFGETWYNQNWLTHVAQYWLYLNVSPDAVVYFTWAMAVAVFALTGLATYYRTNSGLAAVLAGAAVGFGSRDFLSARPATTGYFCIAALWLIFCALEGQREKRRWWPVFAILPLMLIWGNAHGSFVFAYGMIAMYVGHWVVVWLVNKLFLPAPQPTSSTQMVGIAGMAALSFLLLILISPFGWENFTHQGKVASSAVFRSVSEWTPPFTKVASNYPPMTRFWWLLGATVVGMTSIWVISLIVSITQAGRRELEPRNRLMLYSSLFDVAAIAIGLGMTLWARRFAPMFYIFAAPVFAAWILMLARPLTMKVKETARMALMLATLPLALGLGWQTTRRAVRELNVPRAERPNQNLLEAVTRYDNTPHDALMYLRDNDLRLNLLVEWTQGGMVMFFAPNCRVFIDGRAQQVYTEQQYLNYFRAMVAPQTPEAEVFQIINSSGADAVVVRVGVQSAPLYKLLLRNREWIWVLYSPSYGVFVKRGSEGLKRIRELIDRGEERRPDTGEAMATRANVLFRTAPLDLPRAVELWVNAIERKVDVGAYWYAPLISALIELKRIDDAIAYIRAQDARVRANGNLGNEQKQALLAALGRCYKVVEQRRGAGSQPASGEAAAELPDSP